MPLYKFKNNTTNEITTELFSYKSKLKFLKDNPEIVAYLEAPALVSDRIIMRKHLNSDYKNMLTKINKDLPNTTVKDY